MSPKRINIKTTKEDIINYWIKFEAECDLNFDWAEAGSICWRCGCKKNFAVLSYYTLFPWWKRRAKQFCFVMF